MRPRRAVSKNLRATFLTARGNCSNFLRITSLADPHPLTPIESHPYKNSGEGAPSHLDLQFSVHSSKLRILQLLCFHTLHKTAGVYPNNSQNGTSQLGRNGTSAARVLFSNSLFPLSGRSTVNCKLPTSSLRLEGSGFAGGRNRLLDAFLGAMRRGDDQDDGGKNNDGSNNRAQRNDFVCDEPSQKQGYYGIDQCIGGDARGVALLKDIKVRREADTRPDCHEVSQRDPGAPRDRGEMEAVKLSGDQAGDEKNRAADKTLHGHAQQCGTGHAAVLRVNRAAGPGKAANDQNRHAAQVHALRAAQMGWPDKKRDAGKAQNDANQNPRNGPVAARTKPVHDDEPERHHGHQHRGDPRRHSLFSPADAAVSSKREQAAGHRGRFPVGAGRPDAGFPAKERVKEHSHGKVAKSGQHERRDCLYSQADGQIGGAPDDVHGGKGSQKEGPGTRRSVRSRRVVPGRLRGGHYWRGSRRSGHRLRQFFLTASYAQPGLYE